MVKVKTEFTAKNLTIFGGYSNIFSFFEKSNVFEKLDRLVSAPQRTKIIKQTGIFVQECDFIALLDTKLTPQARSYICPYPEVMAEW